MAIKKELIGINGEVRKYFKIKRINFDYSTNYFTITCSTYTDETYREKEKQQIEQYRMDKALWELLSSKTEKTPEEIVVWAQIDYVKVNRVYEQAEKLKLKDEVFTVHLDEINDLRGAFYDILKNTEELKGAIDVLENNTVLTDEEVENELAKRIQKVESEMPITGPEENAEPIHYENGGL